MTLTRVMGGTGVSIHARAMKPAIPSLMKFMLRFLCACALIVMLGFCLFGFVATFEPMPTRDRVIWRTVYSLVLVASTLGLFTSLRGLIRCLKCPRCVIESDPATQNKPRSAGTLA
jgi:hypothetical protein